jgi:uncharacterized protein
MPDPGPMSPCINVCVLEAGGLCRGCLRTVVEIAGWMSLSGAEQWGVIRRIAERQGLRAAGMPVIHRDCAG